jgi:hypothetical protein
MLWGSSVNSATMTRYRIIGHLRSGRSLSRERFDVYHRFWAAFASVDSLNPTLILLANFPR